MRWLAAALLMLVVLAGTAQARSFVDDVFVGLGRGGDDTYVYRVGARNVFDGSILRSRIGYLSGHVELAALNWRREDESVYGAVLAPAFRYYFGSGVSDIRPYIRGSIGVAYLSDTQMDGRDLSTRFQFEDRFGIGVLWRRVSAQLTYAHYSNASIRAPNDGIEELLLTVGWTLQ